MLSVQLYTLTTHTDTHAHTNTREWRANEVHGDAAGLSVNPQLADMQLTTSMSLFAPAVEACPVPSDAKGSTRAGNGWVLHLWKSFQGAARRR